jgi:hypothetical protein
MQEKEEEDEGRKMKGKEEEADKSTRGEVRRIM